jgi:hypothetical protein
MAIDFDNAKWVRWRRSKADTCPFEGEHYKPSYRSVPPMEARRLPPFNWVAARDRRVYRIGGSDIVALVGHFSLDFGRLWQRRRPFFLCA